MKISFKTIHRALETASRGTVVMGSWGLIGVITWINYVTKDTFDLSPFYLIALYPITWTNGFTTGVISAGIIAPAWGTLEWRFESDILQWATVVWNVMAVFFLYSFLCFFISSLKKGHASVGRRRR